MGRPLGSRIKVGGWQLCCFAATTLVIHATACRPHMSGSPRLAVKAINPGEVQTGDILGTLKRKENSQFFLLELQNTSEHRILTGTDGWLYELRLFNASGNKLSNMGQLEERIRLPVPDASYFTTLEPGQKVTITLAALDGRGPMQVPVDAVKADCVFLGSAVANLNLSGLSKRKKAQVAYLANTPTCSVR